MIDYFFSRGEFGIMGDKNNYYHLEPLDKDNSLVRDHWKGGNRLIFISADRTGARFLFRLRVQDIAGGGLW